ncbi:B-box zinc finger protein 21-like [Salvia divinorum]|uniref:B-box zinc finger protein 21-like n=1 Tax=Salvia divinorum TaxID=28513 RepID=A0ABD1HY06_SALDI
MKILCDVCDQGEASVYCTADEASLCASCDHRVHHANKLAGKHRRFSLLHPSPKHSPLCDICQERSAFLFCQEDRAILCRECDIPIHSANQHTQNHTRFLLTGVRLSASPAESPSAPPPAAHHHPSSGSDGSSNLHFSTSSISEYLIETLPGWHVEDLLDSSTPSPSAAVCKSGESDLMLPFWDGDLQIIQDQSFVLNNFGFGLGNGNGSKDQLKEEVTSSRKRRDDNSFAVPQISPPSAAAFNKRSKTFW